MKSYFGTDGIRGRANTHPMTAEIAMKVGMAAGIAFNRGSHRHRVVIGKDTRLSGYMIENALVAGFTAAGVDVFLVGPMPTPAVAMLTRSLRCDIGVMISASHNPFEDNGIKLFGPDGYKLSDELEHQIELLIEEDLSRQLATSHELGRAKRIDGVHDRYIEFAKRTLPKDFTLDGLRVAIDCANGAAYKVAPEVLWELGAEVVAIGVEPNGVNINLNCGSTNPVALSAKVREVRADIGIALDGDADRVLVVDEHGDIVDGDQLMAVIAESWADEGRLAAGGIVATIMSNLGLERFLSGKGIELARTKVGDRYVVEHMREHGYNVGGEQSGHIVLSDYGTTGDGLISALQLMAVMRGRGEPVSVAARKFDPVPQVLKNVRFAGGKPLERSDVRDVIDAGRARLGGSGRLVIRPSGTEPLIRVMAEGDDLSLVNSVVDDIIGVLRHQQAA
ncbi:phosphoglucosamine mutase [Aureimonas sp. OT7]|uniref:Phosphoglucosamine mutase n=1 Tax=Aureimonas altamirensis TaxID=370622 RepID=A0A0B1Q609_9HYPH|nr:MULTISPECIES: phosphoglucosamine mutase [Aureimonas]KHJ54816.1 phosphoglucosamine mutase [Aureimonas altamirensis]QOG06133.1 phosphoglucosamine mutase [Aureimonas sp. OT7]